VAAAQESRKRPSFEPVFDGGNGMDGNALLYWIRYMAEIVLSGNFDNEWLVGLPAESVDSVLAVGQWVSTWLGW
jgi:hypothetical protein